MCEYYITSSGRKARRVDRQGFVSEEALDEILINEYGISPEELENDLLDSTSSYVSTTKAEIVFDDEEDTSIVLYASSDYCEDENDMDVTYWLQNEIESDELNWLWRNHNNRRAIGALIRDPGGWHEWLMVASIPYLKAMGIPMDWIKAEEFCTPTDECNFIYTDSDGDTQEGHHGGAGSGHMHWVLLNSYAGAYEEWANSAPSTEPGPIIANHLDEFKRQFFEEGAVLEELEDLIQALRNLQINVDESDTLFL